MNWGELVALPGGIALLTGGLLVGVQPESQPLHSEKVHFRRGFGVRREPPSCYVVRPIPQSVYPRTSHRARCCGIESRLTTTAPLLPPTLRLFRPGQAFSTS